MSESYYVCSTNDNWIKVSNSLDVVKYLVTQIPLMVLMNRSKFEFQNNCHLQLPDAYEFFDDFDEICVAFDKLLQDCYDNKRDLMYFKESDPENKIVLRTYNQLEILMNKIFPFITFFHLHTELY